MDKVDPSVSLLNPNYYLNLKSKKASDKKNLKTGPRTTFGELLDKAAGAGELGPLKELSPSEEALTELMDAVHSTGSDLLDRPFKEEILRYKKAVRDFIHYVVENCYELQKSEGIKKKVVLGGEIEWKAKLFNQVQVVDKKLEELAAAILSGQFPQLTRLSKLDEIKGLLVDLTITGMIRERNE